jgi:hypothetical protein
MGSQLLLLDIEVVHCCPMAHPQCGTLHACVQQYAMREGLMRVLLLSKTLSKPVQLTTGITVNSPHSITTASKQAS